MKRFSGRYAEGLAYEQFKHQITKEIAKQDKVHPEIKEKILKILDSNNEELSKLS